MTDPLNAKASLLTKLGSIVIHAEELGGNVFDRDTLKQLCDDPEVVDWLHKMRVQGLLNR